MAYTIRVQTEEQARLVRDGLARFLPASRFVIGDMDTVRRSRKGWEVRLFLVRLKVKKGYCGNHPGPCVLTGKKHFVTNYLEGLDWVSFNDLVNDLLDELGLEADVRSHIWVRRGGKRRIDYGIKYGPFGHADWERDGDYADYRGKSATATEYPHGTPGIFGWQEWHREEVAA
jgi:hypothetical protein